MRISDWSSDVCSSDLAQVLVVGVGELTRRDVGPVAFQLLAQRLRLAGAGQQPLDQREALGVALRFIGRQRLAGGRRGVPILVSCLVCRLTDSGRQQDVPRGAGRGRSEEQTAELQSLMRISYAGF